MLTPQLLQQLEDRWRASGAPVDALRPGLSEVQIETAIAAIGLVPSEEAVLWWSWHDGAEQPRDRAFAPRELALATLGGAVTATLRSREIVRAAFAGGAVAQDDVWNPDWLVVLHSGNESVTADCGAGHRQASPVHRVWYEDPEIPNRPTSPSLGAFVRDWIDDIDAGRIAFDVTSGIWRRAPPASPP